MFLLNKILNLYFIILLILIIISFIFSATIYKITETLMNVLKIIKPIRYHPILY
jgi:hypothetical protein